MSEAEVVYSDVKFTRSHGKTKETVSSSQEPTYAEVKTSKTQPSAQPPAGPQPTKPIEPNKKGTVTSERVAIVVLSVLLVAALCALGALGFVVSDRMKLQTLKDLEIETLKKNITAGSQCKPPPVEPTCPTLPVLNKQCQKCEEGWDQHGEWCYYFSTEKLTWNKSRDGCRDKGGDLVKIDSREEQTFLDGRLREKMKDPEDKFWIGLTDSQTEGTFLWTDGSELDTSLTFWSLNEPDNMSGENPEGEDCVIMGKKEGADDLKCWFDASCKVLHKSICEKRVITGLASCVCAYR